MVERGTMKFEIIYFVKMLFFVTQIACTFNENTRCTHSDGKGGACVAVKNCARFNKKYLTNIDIGILRKFKCKLNGNLRGVCCSKTNIYIKEKTTVCDTKLTNSSLLQNNNLEYSERQRERQNNRTDKKTNSLDCITPDNEDGACVLRHNCPTFNKKNFNKNDLRLLRKFICKFKSNLNGVCCSKKSILLGEIQENPYNDNIHRPCKLSTNENGKCINVRDCTTLWSAYNEHTLNIDEHKKACFSKHSRFYNQRNPIVCCTPPANMTETLLSLPLLLSSECGKCSTNQKIIGNCKENIPWLARLKYENVDSKIDIGCMGSLIHEKFILTSAHCLIHMPTFKLTSVDLGSYDQPQEMAIKEVIIHPDYNLDTKESDIGLIRLLSDCTFTDLIKPICLPIIRDRDKHYLENTNIVYVSGWGKQGIDANSFEYISQTAKVNVIPNYKCQQELRKSLKHHLTYYYMCTKGHCKNDTCYDTSGSALMQANQNEQGNVYYECVGIISYGPMKSNNKLGTISVRTIKFVNWILQQFWLVQ